jgi:hemolysin activation/secretion protein
VQVIEGSISEVTLKGEGTEQFGVRPLLDPVLAEQPSRHQTLERQLLLINGRPGVRITDTALEEIGVGSGRFRLAVYLKTWHIYTSFGLDNLGSQAVGPWQTYATGAFNSYLIPGDTLALYLSTTPGDPRQLAFGRCPTMSRSALTARASVPRPFTAKSGPATSGQRQHQNLGLRGSGQHRPGAIAEIDTDADRGRHIQQRVRERRHRSDLRRSHPHHEPDFRLPAAG